MFVIMSIDFTVRKARIEDVDIALYFRNQLFLEMGSEEEEMIENADEEIRSRYLEEYQQESICHYIAYNASNQPIGIVGALIKRDFPYYLFAPGYYGWIIDVYTKPGYRGGKIATTLLQRTHEWLFSKGVYESKLLAFGKKPKELYEKLGYHSTWEMSLNLTDNHKTYNQIIDESSSKRWRD